MDVNQKRSVAQFGLRSPRNMKLDRPEPRKMPERLLEPHREIHEIASQENETRVFCRRAPRNIKLDKPIPRKHGEKVENTKVITNEIGLSTVPSEAIQSPSSKSEAISHIIDTHHDVNKKNILTIPTREPVSNILVTINFYSRFNRDRRRENRLGFVEGSPDCHSRKQQLESVVGKVIHRDQRYRRR